MDTCLLAIVDSTVIIIFSRILVQHSVGNPEFDTLLGWFQKDVQRRGKALRCFAYIRRMYGSEADTSSVSVIRF